MGQAMSMNKDVTPPPSEGMRKWALPALGALAFLAGLAFFFWPDGDEALPGVSYRPVYVNAGEMLHLTQVLSSDALQGRGAGTPGNEAARGFIHKRFEEIGLAPLPGFEVYTHSFSVLPKEEADLPFEAANLIGFIPGSDRDKGPIMVLTAHYDHLGVRDGKIYNGADDNASGTSALIALAEYFAQYRPRHDMVIAALDAEEIGFLGARQLVAMDGLDLSRVALNINLDMVGRSEAGELYVAGTYHTPLLAQIIEGLGESVPVTLIKGHDRPEQGADDWTLQSDHAPFHQAGIPFLYFGVEDHAGYHHPSDDFENLTLDFFVRAADAIVMVAKAADARLDEIHAQRVASQEN